MLAAPAFSSDGTSGTVGIWVLIAFLGIMSLLGTAKLTARLVVFLLREMRRETDELKRAVKQLVNEIRRLFS